MNLSPREAEIARRVSEGQPLKAIAEELRGPQGEPLHISTVKVYVRRAKDKLGAKTVTHLALLYVAIESRQN
jgi:DNA-binding CsgD family transcriptional regulator